MEWLQTRRTRKSSSHSKIFVMEGEFESDDYSTWKQSVLSNPKCFDLEEVKNFDQVGILTIFLSWREYI